MARKPRINQIRRHCSRNNLTPEEAADYFLSFFKDEFSSIFYKMTEAGIYICVSSDEHDVYRAATKTRVRRDTSGHVTPSVCVAFIADYDGDPDLQAMSFFYAYELGWLLLGNQNAYGHAVHRDMPCPVKEYEEFACRVLVPKYAQEWAKDDIMGMNYSDAISYLSTFFVVPKRCVEIACKDLLQEVCI